MQTNNSGHSGNGGGNGQRPSGGSRAPSDGEESAGSREKREEVKKGKRKARSPVPAQDEWERNRQRRNQKIAQRMASEAAAANTLNRIGAQENETRRRLEESQRAVEDARWVLDETTERANGTSRQWMLQEARLKATMARMSDEEMSESSDDSLVDEDPSEQEALEQCECCKQRDLHCIIDESVPGCRECERKGVRCSFEDDAPAPVKRTEKDPACKNCTKAKKRCFVIKGHIACEFCTGKRIRYSLNPKPPRVNKREEVKKTGNSGRSARPGRAGKAQESSESESEERPVIRTRSRARPVTRSEFDHLMSIVKELFEEMRGPGNIHKPWPARKEQMAEKRKEREPAPKPKKKQSKKIAPEASVPPACSERAPAEPEDETDTQIGAWREQAAWAEVPDAPENPEDRGEGGSGLAGARKTPEKPARRLEGSDDDMEEVKIPVKPEPVEIVIPAELTQIVKVESVADEPEIAPEVKPEPEEPGKILEKKEKTAGTGPKPGQVVFEISLNEHGGDRGWGWPARPENKM
ncbi:hypothetical protein C8F01DRAFT_1255793 [Mycena amicta]|nr:hypothetical protein C8F01DRAFT_1255793 [Mycena amicta]